jgi:type IV secretion system protein TrbC
MKTRHLLIILCSTVILLSLWPEAVFASDTSEVPELTQGVSKLANAVKGPLAYGIGIIAIVAVIGTLIFGHDLNGFLKTGIFLFAGLGMLAGAVKLWQNVFGADAAVVQYAPEQLPSSRPDADFRAPAPSTRLT